MQDERARGSVLPPDFAAFLVEAIFLFAAGWSIKSDIETFDRLGGLLCVDMIWALASHYIHFPGTKSRAVKWSAINVFAIIATVLVVVCPVSPQAVHPDGDSSGKINRGLPPLRRLLFSQCVRRKHLGHAIRGTPFIRCPSGGYSVPWCSHPVNHSASRALGRENAGIDQPAPAPHVPARSRVKRSPIEPRAPRSGSAGRDT